MTLENGNKERRWDLWGVLILTALAYVAMFANGWTNFDDDRLIVDNAQLTSLSWANIKALFSNYYDNLYQPLTALSWAVNHQLSGFDPWSYQLFNMLLHVGNTWLVFRLVSLLTKHRNWALITALLFGIHPIHVESVAWLSERKDVLYTLFFLAGLVRYVRYVQSQKIKHFALAVGSLALALLAKGQAVTFVLCLPLIDIYLQNKAGWEKRILGYVPLVGLVLGSAYITTQGIQQVDVIYFSNEYFTTTGKVVLGGHSIILSAIKSIVPYSQSAFYSYPPPADGVQAIHWVGAIGALLLGLLTLLALLKKWRALFFGLAFFLLNLVLFVKILPLQTGDYMWAERFVYIPSIGLYFILAYFIVTKIKTFNLAAKVVGSVIVILLVTVTAKRTTVWEDGKAVWSDVIAKNPNSLLGPTKLGQYYESVGNDDKAIEVYEAASEKQPLHYLPYVYLAQSYMRKKNYEAARTNFGRAIQLKPKVASNYWLRGLANDLMGDCASAIIDYTATLERDPNQPKALNNRAFCYAKSGEYERAVKTSKKR